MKHQSNYALRIAKSLKSGIEKAAKADGVSFNQFVVSAAAEKLSALQTAEYFTARAAKGSLSRFDEIMARKYGEPPGDGDKVEGGGSVSSS